MSCHTGDADNTRGATEFFRRQRARRDDALATITAATTADEAADLAGGEDFIEHRRGVFGVPGSATAIIYNNNPCIFRAAEWSALKRLLAESGYAVASEGQSSDKLDDGEGYTLTLIVSRTDGSLADPSRLGDLMAAALREIGRADQLYHGIPVHE